MRSTGNPGHITLEINTVKNIYFKENRERQKILANSYQVKFGTKKFK